MARFWDLWSASTDIDPDEASIREDEYRLFGNLTRELTRHSIAKEKILAKRNLAGLKADVDIAGQISKERTKYAEIAGAETRTKITAISRMESALNKSWGDYQTKASTIYDPVRSKMQEGFATNNNAGAWSAWAGGYFQNDMQISRQSPQFTATFRAMNEQFGRPFELDDKGLIKRDSGGNFILTKSGQSILTDQATKRGVFEIAEAYQNAKVSQNVALEGFTTTRDLIDQAKSNLKMGKVGNAETNIAEAKNKIEETNAAASAAFGVDAEAALAKLEEYKKADAEYQDTKRVWSQLEDKIFKGDGDDQAIWKLIGEDGHFAEWAADRGYVVGYIAENGEYIARGDDQRALTAWFRESDRDPGKYANTVRPSTDDIIQILDPEGNIIADGYRLKIHAADPKGGVRVVGSDGVVRFFEKDKIGKVLVRSSPAKIEPQFAGSKRRGRKAKEQLGEIGRDVDLTAVTPAEKVTETQFAVRQDEMGDSFYMTKEEYDAARSKMQFVTNKNVGGKLYLVSGDQVLEMARGDDGAPTLTPVTDEVEKKAAIEAPSTGVFTTGDGQALTLNDLMDGDKFKTSLESGFISGGVNSDDEISAAQLKVQPPGIILTDTPKGFAQGPERSVGGTTFVDATSDQPRTASTVPPAELEAARAAADKQSADTSPDDPNIEIDVSKSPGAQTALDIDASFEGEDADDDLDELLKDSPDVPPEKPPSTKKGIPGIGTEGMPDDATDIKADPGAVVEGVEEVVEGVKDAVTKPKQPSTETAEQPSETPKVKRTPAEVIRGVLRPNEERRPMFPRLRDALKKKKSGSKPEPVSPTPSVTDGKTDLNTQQEVASAERKPKANPGVTFDSQDVADKQKEIADAMKKSREESEQRKKAKTRDEAREKQGREPTGL